MILSFDQSLSKIGYTFVNYEENLIENIVNYSIAFEKFQNIILSKESQIIALAKKNFELNLEVLKTKIKWTKKQLEDLEKKYYELLLLKKEIENKYNFQNNIEISHKNKQIRNVLNNSPFDNNDLNYGLIETDLKNLERLNYYEKKINELIIKYNPKLIVIEGYSYGSSNTRSVFELGELAGMIKLSAYKNKIPLLIVPPSTLKLFISDDGKAEKEVMIKNVKIKFNKEFYWNSKISDDITDSYCLNLFSIFFPFMNLDFQIKNKILINKE